MQNLNIPAATSMACFKCGAAELAKDSRNLKK